jgi:hypothetical protein
VENEQIEQFDACLSSFCSVGSVRSGTKGVGMKAFDRGCQNRRSIRSWLYKKELVTNRLRRLSKLGKRCSARFRPGKTCRDVPNEAQTDKSMNPSKRYDYTPSMYKATRCIV